MRNRSCHKTPYLFVYGTLQKAFRHPLHRLLSRYADYKGEGSLCGRLYEIDNYPGAILTRSCKEQVYGELYRLKYPSIILPLLDRYEECDARFPKPHEYRRIITDLYTDPGKHLRAWVYLYNRPVHPKKRVSNERYLPNGSK